MVVIKLLLCVQLPNGWLKFDQSEGYSHEPSNWVDNTHARPG